MGPFRCTTCGAPSDQATRCAACNGRTFVLSREAQTAGGRVLSPEPRGQLVSIADAPSLRRQRQRQKRFSRP
jgi:DNA-directed RNA polymerase subunit RPC12/RpoP